MTATTGHPDARWVGPLCWAAVAMDGYDLVVLGVVLPSLLQEPAWGLTPSGASTIASIGLVGVMVGAASVGTATDVVGRRAAVIGTVVLFSLLTLASAFAPSPTVLAVLRFLAGLGLGGILPTAIALVNEVAPPGRSGAATTRLMTGYHVGAVTVSLLGIGVVERFGWRPMFVLGALPALVLVPLLVRYLPESPDFVRARSRRALSAGASGAGSLRKEGASGAALSAGASSAGPRTAVSVLFRDGRGRSTLAFWATSVLGLLLVYGLNTWLPQIMREAGYDLGAALSLLLVLNVGAVLGLLVAGRVADRIGNRRSTVLWFAGAAVALALLSVRLPGAAVYAGVLLAGVFVFSAQVLVYAYVSRVYPTAARGTALGTTSSVGRLGGIAGPLVGGALLTAGIAYPWGFYLFAAAAAVAAACIAAVDRQPAGA